MMSCLYNTTHENVSELNRSGSKNVDGGNSLQLSKHVIERGWFLYQVIKFFSNRKKLSSACFPTDAGNLIDLEQLCEEACDIIDGEEPDILMHTCKIPGCAQGYASIDDNEKIHSKLCAAPKSKIKFTKSMPKFLNCCPNLQ